MRRRSAASASLSAFGRGPAAHLTLAPLLGLRPAHRVLDARLAKAQVAERTTDEGTTGAELVRQADMLTGMLVAQFGIRGSIQVGSTPGDQDLASGSNRRSA